MSATSEVEQLMGDLDTITRVAGAEVISESKPTLDWGETRPAAIVYLDVVGFTGLSTELPSEALSKLIDRSFRIFELTAKSHGGYCDKVVGDAALYVFPGHPNHAPPCSGALRAARDMLERLDGINESLSDYRLDLAVRVGVSYGEVTRQEVGSEDAQLTVMGETVNLAQRLETEADANSVLTVETVLERAGEAVDAQPAGTRKLKGIGERETYRVTGVSEEPVRLRGSFRRLTPLVGRDRELERCTDLLTGWLGSATEDDSNLLLLQGPMAVGKSRLAYEATETVAEELDLALTRVNFTEHGGVGELAAQIARIAGLTADNLVERWEELCSAAKERHEAGREFAERARRQIRLLALVLDCPEVDYSGLEQSDPESFLLNCKLALRYCLELVAGVEDRPLLIVLEDLQWMSQGAQIIEYLMNEVEAAGKIALVATARTEYDHESGCLGEDDFQTVVLERLNEAGGEQLVNELLPGLDLPPTLRSELHDKAEGLPYFYEEFARMLLRRDLAVEREGEYELAAEPDSLDLPDDLSALVLGRLDRLSRELRRLVGRASVIGRKFREDFLRELDERLGISGPEHPREGLRLLSEQKVIGREGEHWYFEHAATRDAAYSALLTPTRRKLHGLCAELIEDRITVGTRSQFDLTSDLVEHLEGAGEYGKAHRTLGRFLMSTGSSGKFEGWEEMREWAERLWERIRPGEPGTAGESPWLMTAEADRCWVEGKMDRAEETYQKAVQRSRELEEEECEARALGGLGSIHYIRNSLDRAEECWNRALQLSRERGDRRGEGKNLGNLGLLHHRRGERERASTYFEQALEIARRRGDRQQQAIALGNLGILRREQSRPEDSRRNYQRALEIVRELGARGSEGIWVGNLGNLHREQGRLEEARRCYDAALEIAREIGDRKNEGLWLGSLGNVHRERGRPEEARACYERALGISREVGLRADEGFRLWDLGELNRRQGRVEEARSRFREAIEISRELDNPRNAGSRLSKLGKYLLETGEVDEAGEKLEQAGELLGESEDSAELARLQCHWVHYHLAREEAGAAASKLDQAMSRFEESGQDRDSDLRAELDEARELVDAAGETD